MGSVSFVIRTFIVTVLLIMLLQVRWEGTTLEVHTLKFIRSSEMTGTVSGTAEGAIRAVTAGWSQVTRFLNSKFGSKFENENQPGNRVGQFHWNRGKEHFKEGAKESVDYIKENANKAREKARKSIRKFIDETDAPSEGESENSET